MSAAATPADVLAGTARWCVVEGDALATLAALLPQSLDAIITDPPYASTGDAASIMKTDDGAVSVPREMQFYEAWVREHLGAWKRVLKPTGAVWMTIDWRGAMCVDQATSRLGLRTPVVGVWNRGGLGMGHLLRKTYECFVVIPMAGFKRRRMDEPDVWSVPWTPANRDSEHAAQKPVDLLRRAVALITSPDDLIFDPFAGSGTTGCAAILDGRRFIGAEREGHFAAIARARCAAAETGADWRAPASQPSLFAAVGS